MSENYTLPIESNWTVEDIVTVSNLIDGVLAVYETGISKRILLERFDQFREVMPAKSEQKQFDRDFEQQTGYSIYKTMQLAQKTIRDKVRA
ncbi:UPF0223 family protein [Leuconostoc kimchii]|uniref:Uncharacterized protein n=2 Tax=Leuconostoc kimchii TaxID=136609 RepID=D5T3X7_LEUKI|nr:UPF0223 family protein [Leuconostoc kimchii]ADG41379.1 hypothetical protein LKI_09200 [Leuconostoc kimchii IMSNU 11154]QBR47768.1 hypothetical protein EW139_06400 [Leuconostoc kimchii]